tara:strand:- start:3263 stop:4531 length:1269 start_codon:yes stop_codon:yes gene_type:complete
MIDIKRIREQPEFIQKEVKSKGVDMSIESILGLDAKRRGILQEVEGLKAQRNVASASIGQLKKAKEDASSAIAAVSELKTQIADLDHAIRDIDIELDDMLLRLPNISHESVPEGVSADDNVVVREWGQKKVHAFDAVEHKAFGESLSLFDFERGAKVAGSGFPAYIGQGAKLERALIQFFLDTLSDEFGFTEVIPPFVVNKQSLVGTGQLPKFNDQQYHCVEDDLYLIPTAEVPVTNLHSNEVLPEAKLPISYCAYSACFRREAGSYGKDVRGFLRLHQFNKVEMVRFVNPTESYEHLEKMVSYAERLLQELGLNYRVLELCKGDLSFGAAKCYDLECWSPVEGKWLEVSSVSNFEEFQARRASIRSKIDGKNQFVHTLNGSGLATPRVMVALLETWQNADGSFTIPPCLRPYMKGAEKIEA